MRLLLVVSCVAAACGELRPGCGDGAACGAEGGEHCGAAPPGAAPPCLMTKSARAASVNAFLTNLYHGLQAAPAAANSVRTALTGRARRAARRVRAALGPVSARARQTSLADIFQHLKNIVVKYEESSAAKNSTVTQSAGKNSEESEDLPVKETPRQTIVPTLSVLFSNFLLNGLNNSGQTMVLWGATKVVLLIYAALAALYLIGEGAFAPSQVDRMDRVTNHLDHVTNLLDRLTNGY